MVGRIKKLEAHSGSMVKVTIFRQRLREAVGKHIKRRDVFNGYGTSVDQQEIDKG